ncbi:MAG TPA: hypothetical protein PKZ92_00990 [Candidatus Woesebacteria bacterium]|jgi:hypothetical protein|nr:hypothetical protein [Candidatus Shapirobacteria bacterium]HOR01818.1 hypothetical protein [Candidatus Woesebacteria bacterium]
MIDSKPSLLQSDLLIDTERESQIPLSLPFSYIRVNDPAEAMVSEKRISRNIFSGVVLPKTDEEILSKIKSHMERREWFMANEWREKGQPDEQISICVGNKAIELYNYNKASLTDEHLAVLQRVFTQFGSHFPQLLDRLNYILIDNKQPESIWGDEDKYPLNGLAMKEWQVFKFSPRGVNTAIPHRLQFVSNFEGTGAHELTHFIEDLFSSAWQENFKWGYCMDNTERFKFKEVSPGKKQWCDKNTDQTFPSGKFPFEDYGFVSFYAQLNQSEDICESMVAYLYAPEWLQQISSKKYNIFKNIDANLQSPEVSVTRVDKDKIKLPEIKPEIITYYIEEPKND